MTMDYTAAAKAALAAMVAGEPAELPAKPGPISLPLKPRPETLGPGNEIDLPQRLGELRSVAREPEVEIAVRSVAPCRASAATIGVISRVWARIIAVGVNSRPSTPRGPERDRAR